MRYLQLDDDALAAHWGDLLVPSRRLQQALLASLVDRAQASPGRASALPHVWTPDELLASLHDELVFDGRVQPRRRLSAIATRLLIESTLPNDLRPLADLFESAWRLVHDYELTAEVRLFDEYEDARRFRVWAAEFRVELERRRVVTPAELAGVVARALETRHEGLSALHLAYIGFAHVTPSLQRMLAAIAASGAPPTLIPFANERTVAPRVVAARNTRTELRLAIEWAHERLIAMDGSGNIGIVVPDLTERYDAVLRELYAAFGTAESSAPFNLSGGVPLGAVPIAADAIGLLRCYTSEQPSAVVTRTLCSPFFAFDSVSRLPRGARLPSAYSLTTFAAATGHPLAAELGRQAANWPSSGRLDGWLRSFGALLRAAGWPGAQRLTSETFQAKQRFDALFDELATASESSAPSTAQEALATLASAAEAATFAPQRPAAPIQVLGYLESAGLRFTDLWVTGLDADSWPPAPRPHPFVPRRWQLQRVVARSTPQLEADFCTRMLREWRSAAPEVVASYPLQSRSGEPLRPTPLLAPYHATASPSAAVSERSDRKSPRVEIEDDAPGVDVVDGALTAAVVRDQSLCPFRAFAIHRCGLDPSTTPSLLPTADERGTTIHDALQLAYRSVHSRADLLALSIDGRVTLAADAARDALGRSSQRNAPRGYLANEEDRLARVLLDWFDVDAARPDFVVDAVEQEQSFELGSAPVRIRVDRIDRDSETGERILLDYKTGTVGIGQWRGRRPEDPQLPLYTIGVGGVHGVAVAQVGGSGSRLNGIVSRPDRYARSMRIRISAPEALGAASWDDLLATWRTIVQSLASEFLRGHARVDPLHAGVCRTCHLQTFCRIGDRGVGEIDG